MVRKTRIASMASAWASISCLGLALAQETPPGVALDRRPAPLAAEFHPEHVLVRFRPNTAKTQKQKSHVRVGCQAVVRKRYRCVAGLELISVTRGKVLEAIAAYEEDANVLYAEPDYRIYPAGIPNDPAFDQLWGMQNTGQTIIGIDGIKDPGVAGADIRAPKAWDLWTGDPNFKIAVVDTGVDHTHPDLAANIWTNPNEAAGDANADGCPGICGVDDDGDGLIDEDSFGLQPGEPGYSNDLSDDDDENGWADDIHGYDFADDHGDPMNADDHGTHVAGTIGAVGDNTLGVVGVNWHCDIVSLKVFFGEGSVVSSAIEAMEYIIVNSIRVSNHSWLTSGFSQALRDEIAASQAIGHIVVAAAGNFGINNDDIPFYPASFDLDNVIAVAAMDNDDNLGALPFPPFLFASHFGPTTVDIGAPGVNIYSTVLESSFDFNVGTSMAAPHVTGVVGLIMSRLPGLPWQLVKERVLLTARPVASLTGITVTGGVVNAGAAVWDCNDNNAPDEQDIASGTSDDCNGNLLPDECEPDCNSNGIADSCDIASNLSDDCTVNGIPDECEPDCNNNGIADSCDIADGTSKDCAQESQSDCCSGTQFPNLPGCSDPDIEACVCSAHPSCCEIGWRNVCAEQVDTLGCGVCGGRNGIPDECEGVISIVYADVNGDGVVDARDILCVLDGFQGVFNCSLKDVDLKPCGGDGVIDSDDIVAVVDAFRGVSACPCP